MFNTDFDPYHEWLGIPPEDQPANHYRLLGLELFEADWHVIESTSLKQIAHIRNGGEPGAVTVTAERAVGCPGNATQ